MQKVVLKYIQIANDLQLKIDNGFFPSGGRIPSEDVLAEEYNTSRSTIRKVKKFLVQKNVLSWPKGRSCYVSMPRFVKEQRVISSKEMTNSLGVTVNIIVDSITHVVASDSLCKLLELPENARVWKLVRRSCIKNHVVFIETSYLPKDRFSDLNQHDFSVASLEKILIDCYGVEIASVTEDIEVDELSKAMAKLIVGSSRASALVIKSQSYDSDNHPIKYSETLYNYRLFTYRTIRDAKE